MSKFKSRTRWREKLADETHSKIVFIPPRMQKRFGRGTMLIAKPRDVDALIRKIKKGQLVTPSAICSRLARDNHVNATCPLTTGIFIRIAAEAAEEDLRDGKTRVTPYWRVVSGDGHLNQKFPGGAAGQARRLRKEGHRIEKASGKRPPRVKDFENSLVKF